MRRTRGTRKLETVSIEGFGSINIFINLDSGRFYYYPAEGSDQVFCDTLDKAREGAKKSSRLKEGFHGGR